jgi:hypothetical protein
MTEELESREIEFADQNHRARVHVTDWHCLPPSDWGTANLHIRLPSKIEVCLGDAGQVASVTRIGPDTAVVEEALHQVKSLKENGQIVGDDQGTRAGATHEIATDSKGRRILKRKRFSTIG